MELLDNLYDAYDFLYVKQEYNELIDKFEKDTESCKSKYLRMKNEKPPLPVGYWLAFFSGAALLFSGGLKVIYGLNFGRVTIFAGIFVIIAARMIAKNKKKQPEKNAADFWNKVGSPTCIENDAKIAQIENELEEFSVKNYKVLDFLPKDYRDIYAVGYMIHVIKNGLADNMKEALNLYTEQQHRWKMESAMRGMAQSVELHNREMASYMSEISEQQRITNSRLADIELLTFLDYVNN